MEGEEGGMQKTIAVVFGGVRELGLPSVLCLLCVGYLIWQSVIDQTQADQRLEIEKERTAEIAEVVNQCTASSVEMTAAVRSLHDSNIALCGSMKDLEIEVMRHFPGRSKPEKRD